MRTLITFFLLTTIAIGQEGIPANVGTRVLPPGLEVETDLNAIKQRRIEALQGAVEVLRKSYESGLINISFPLAAQIELAIAKLDFTTVKKDRLDHIETALATALKTWQRVVEMRKVGLRGGDDATECWTRAAVFKFRVMWLAESAAGPQQPEIRQPSTWREGIPANVGTGVLPPGLEVETDLNAIKQKRIEALQGTVEALQTRSMSGLDNIDFLLAAQNEQVIAKLDSTTVKEERLDHIETALASALKTWQRVEELRKAGSQGGEPAKEFQSRAAVFKFRVMWLAEKATGPQQPSIGQEGIPANVGTGVLPPGLEETDLNAIKQKRIEASQGAVEALQTRLKSGRDDDTHFLLAAQIELLTAKLDSTTVKKNRLDHIETALSTALMTWQRVEALRKGGMSGGDYATECQTRAAVFKFREMWLAESAAGPQ